MVIAPLIKDSEDTLLETARGNELIQAVNVMLNMDVRPTGAGYIIATKGNALLVLGNELMDFEFTIAGGDVRSVKIPVF